MTWVQQTIADFGQSIGIQGLTLSDENNLQMTLDSGQVLDIEYLPNREPLPEIVVSFSQQLDYQPASQVRQALHLTHYRSPKPWPLQAAIRDKFLVLSMRIPERSFLLNELEQTITQLMNMQNTIAERRY